MGSRYGVKIRKQFNEIQSRKRASYACPKCGKKSVRRVAYALWKCRSCNASFAGGAYSPETMVGAAAKRVLRAEKPAALVEEELSESDPQQPESDEEQQQNQ